MNLNKEIQEQLKIYYLSCNFLVECFIKKYFCSKKYKFYDVDHWWVGDKIGEVLCVNDYYINFDDIIYALENKVSKKYLFAWYDWSITDESYQHHHLSLYINLQNIK